jgi:hypothetical protein
VSGSLAEAFGLEPAAVIPPGAAVRPPPPGMRSLCLPDQSEDGVGELRAERSRREVQDVATPSALIRRATAEWPGRCAQVAAIAAQLGIPQGQTWLRVIEAGILSLQDDLAEEGI